MKNSKTSRLAKRVSRSRQLRNQAMHQQSQSNPADHSNQNEATPAKAAAMQLPIPDDQDVVETQIEVQLESSMAAASPNTAPSPNRGGMSTASPSRAKRFQLVEKRRKAMQRVAARASPGKTEEEKKTDDEALLEEAVEVTMAATPPSKQAVARATPQSAPARHYRRARSVSRERRQVSPPPEKTVSEKASVKTPPRRYSTAGRGTPPPHHNTATTISSSTAHPAAEDTASDVQTDVGSQEGSTITTFISNTIEKEFAPPAVARTNFEPLHKQYEKGRPTKSPPPAAKSPPPRATTTTSPTPIKSSPPRFPSRGRAVYLAHAAHKSRAVSAPRDHQESAKPEEPKVEATPKPVVTAKATPQPKLGNTSAVKPKFNYGNKAIKPVVQNFPDAKEDLPEESVPTEKTPSPPKTGVAAMMARFGHKTPQRERPTPSKVSPPRKTTPSWVKAQKPEDESATSPTQASATADEDMPDLVPEKATQEQEMLQKRPKNHHVRSASPSWRRGMSPVPQRPGPRSFIGVAGSNTTPSWVKKTKSATTTPIESQEQVPKTCAASPTLPGVSNKRSFSVSPVPRSAAHAVVAMPSWVKSAESTETNDSEASPQEPAPRRTNNRPSWVKDRAVSPYTVQKTESSVSRSSTPTEMHSNTTTAWSKNHRGLSPVPMNQKLVHRKQPSWSKPKQPVASPEPQPAVEGSVSIESDGPSRFASAYVHRVAGKPAHAIQPQFRKEVTVDISDGASQSPTASTASPIVSSQRSPWNKYNRNESFEAKAEENIPRVASDHTSDSPAPSQEHVHEEGPSEEFSPSQLRARFKALDKRNAAPKVHGASAPYLGTNKSQLDDDSVGDYDDPPVQELSEVETDVDDSVNTSRVVIETPEKVSVSAMAGRFGTVRGKEPKKTPPRVVRPNDWWRSNAQPKTTPEPPPLSKHKQRERRVERPVTKTEVVKRVESPDVEIYHAQDEAVSDPRDAIRDEKPAWLKRRMEEEVIVTNEKYQAELVSKSVKEDISKGTATSSQKVKNDDTPWWLRPHQADAGIKKVLERAVSPETSFDTKLAETKVGVQRESPAPVRQQREVGLSKPNMDLSDSFQERERDFEVEDRPSEATLHIDNTPRTAERRRRFDELMEMQTASTSPSALIEQRLMENTPSRSRRVGVIQSWSARARGENPEEFIETTVVDTPARQNADLPSQEDSDEQSGQIMAEEEENIPTDNHDLPQNKDEEVNPEFEEQSSAKSSTQLSQLGVTPQPWRQMVSDPDQAHSPSPRKKDAKVKSPGASPLKDSRMPSYQVPLAGTELGLPSLIQDSTVNTSTPFDESVMVNNQSRGAPFDESTLLNESSDVSIHNRSGRAPFDESTLVNESSDMMIRSKSGRAPFDESTMLNETSDLVISSPGKGSEEEPKKPRSRLSAIRATASAESIELEPIVDSKMEEPDEPIESFDKVGLIRATASVDSIELETVLGAYTGTGAAAGFDVLASTPNSQRDHPWQKDKNTLSPHTWQRKADSKKTPVAGNLSEPSDNLPEEEKSARDDEEAVYPDISMSHEGSGALSTSFEKIFANSLSQGSIHDAEETGISKDVVFGSPETYGAAGGGVVEESPAVTDRAKAIEHWNGGLNEKPKDPERNQYFFPDSTRNEQRIFKDASDASGVEESTSDAKMPSAVERVYSTTSKDEMDAAEGWQDCDPDIDNYSDTMNDDTFFSVDDSPEKDMSSTRLISNTEESEITAPAELDPFSLDAVAAFNNAAMVSKSKTSSTAFDPFADNTTFGEPSFDFSSKDSADLFAPSSASDSTPKKTGPLILGSKKDTKPINDPRSTKLATVQPRQRAATPTRTDDALAKVPGTPPRSPPRNSRSPSRRPMNISKIQEDLNNLDIRDWVEKPKKVSGAEEGRDLFSSPETENEYPPSYDSPPNNEWSFDQGLPSYEAAVYDADQETIENSTMDGTACEI